MTDVKKEYPDTVKWSALPDGGAYVIATVGYCNVYARGFDSSVEARFAAAALFDRQFEVTDDPDDERFTL